MKNSKRLFHIAIPCHDLEQAHEFYVNKMGCRLARRYLDRLTFEFFGHQLVCHLDPEGIDPEPKVYPRHFGITFSDETEFDTAIESATRNGATFVQPPCVRFSGEREEHRTFFLQDPSNNVLEFKWYRDPEMMF